MAKRRRTPRSFERKLRPGHQKKRKRAVMEVPRDR
ncbi:hypothetical protein CRE_28080 [Caenorhabditis remanei]|uniref:Uncharacterized protein n=1 Tax=Caenorhabditis remanei TaxID=31234 RepID=E3LM72_CAERE|nr:hypothetical protein CRE_28080 [Caenorhabditis remanei]